MVAKKQDRAYGVSQVLEHIEKLQHGHDGLIFTCAQTPYVLGTDEKMYVVLVTVTEGKAYLID
jgi:mRNA guanylyltransferase